MASRDRCGVNNSYDSRAQTCFDEDQVRLLVDAYNRMIVMSRVKLDGASQENLVPIDTNGSKKVLLDQIRDRFRKECPEGDDVCILNQELMYHMVIHLRDDLRSAVRPLGPSGRTEWLANDEIDAVMYPYMKLYSDFCYLGTNASNCHTHPRCVFHNFDYQHYIKRGCKFFGAIFNLDRVGQSGSHWTSFFISLPENKMYYCDSTGRQPNRYIRDFIQESQKKLLKITGNKCELIVNTKAYQNDGSECGVYSCNFIIRMLSQKESFEQIMDNYLDFSQINSCRHEYFRNVEPTRPSDSRCLVLRD